MIVDLKKGPLSHLHCRQIAIAQGLSEGMRYIMTYMTSSENKLFGHDSDFSTQLSKISFEYLNISENCISTVIGIKQTNISQELEASRKKLKALYQIVKGKSDTLLEDRN